MKIQTAIQILERQLSEIQAIQKGDRSWVLQTQEYIKSFFGEQSVLLSFFDKFNFLEHWSYNTEDDPTLLKRKTQAAVYLTGCIQTLKDVGLYKKPRQNFLSSLSDTALWTMFGTILPLIIYLSFYFGKKEGDNKIEKLEIELQKSKDTISSIRITTFLNTYPILKADTSKTEKK